MKKIIIFVLILMFTFSFARVSFAENSADVSVSDDYIGHSTGYTITFIMEDSVKVNDAISIIFDDSIPILRNTGKADEIAVNGVNVPTAPQFFGHRIDIVSPLNIGKNEKVQIVIPSGVLQNPTSPGYFLLNVKIGNDTYTSNYYHITDKSRVKNVSLSKTSDGIEINFTTGENGALKGYTTKTVGMGHFSVVKVIPNDFIFIRFSHILSETFSSISKNDITVNWYNPPLNPDVKIHFEDTDNEEREISICVPKDINANSSVKILIKGISIPDKETGTIYAKVWTSKEFTPVVSNETSIKGMYFLKTNRTVLPDVPGGENGFYKTSPTVTLNVNKGIGIEKANILYSFDGKNFILYSAPVKIEDGSKMLYYYSVGYAGKRKFVESIRKLHFLVDSTCPVIKVMSPLKTNTPFYTLKIEFSDANFDYALIRVSGIEFTATDQNFEIPVYLFDKTTDFTVKAFDKAGNVSEFNGRITLEK